MTQRARRWPAPTHPDGPLDLVDSSKTVKIRHPGYDSPNVLLVLPAIDCISRNQPGVDRRLVLTACGIVACNRYNGFLSKSSNATDAESVEETDILNAGDYYYHVSTSVEHHDTIVSNVSPNPYPVVPRFNHWAFPHQVLDSIWARTGAVRATPLNAERVQGVSQILCCRISQYTQCIERAHVIPRSEKEWFVKNEMSKYANPEYLATDKLLNSASNVIGLRQDIHSLWDNNEILLVPKNVGGQLLMTHCLGANSEVLDLYHNCQVLPLDYVPSQYLFARFAYAILGLLKNFLSAGPARFIITMTESSGQESQWMSGSDWLSFDNLENQCHKTRVTAVTRRRYKDEEATTRR